VSAPRAGYRDAHLHLAAGAADLGGLDLRSGESAGSRVAAAARELPPDALIRGWGWDGEAATAGSLDRAALDHPLVLARADGHAAWLNAAARRAYAVRDENGLVAEDAYDSLRARLPALSPGERATALRARAEELAALGVVAVDDMVDRGAPGIYAALRDRRELPVSAGMWLPGEIDDAEARALLRAFPPDDPLVAVRGIKIFLDGTLRSRTAALFAPYADAPETDGRLRGEPSRLAARVEAWGRDGWPVALHAIGDRAVALALDILEDLPRPRWGAHRIEHAQVVRREDLPRFSAAGIVASLQPGHWSDDRPWIASRLGARPDVIAHPLASLARAGAPIVVGSDWPVSSWDPARILAAACDPARGEEAADAVQSRAWYTSGPR